MEQQNTNTRDGFLPGGGGTDATYGRNPEGVAYTKSGALRKARTKLSNIERMKAEVAAGLARIRGYGRDVLAKCDEVKNLIGNIGKARAQVREAVAFSTTEKVEAFQARLQADIDSAWAKHEAAVEFLADSPDLSAIEGLEESVGTDVETFMRENLSEPEKSDVSEMVAEHLTDELRKALENAGNPSADWAAPWRRSATEDESPDTDNL